ncbi:uncharacterized protein RAG0_07591 [Rhynchosporium agropyri]|uniref:Aminoglycoside phosphotransferase domain-containing protein n=1 Tax=Rhynchosporium agropyri TaxID=914238 RepID=A0A1E1KM60_9HELO|nr:uncharacterized protein RAG0_07591 [Rhynchosporium agropyri]
MVQSCDSVSEHDHTSDERITEARNMSTSPDKSVSVSQTSGSLKVPATPDISKIVADLDIQDADEEEDGGEEAYLRGEKEHFETLRPHVHQLCLDLGLGEPSTIEQIKGGSFNRIIGLMLPSSENSECILRIPRYPTSEQGDPHDQEVMDQVAIHLHLAKYDKFHIPSIVAWDATSNISLKSEYVVQTKLQGASLHDVYYQLPLTERLEVATSVAKMLLNLESITFEIQVDSLEPKKSL